MSKDYNREIIGRFQDQLLEKRIIYPSSLDPVLLCLSALASRDPNPSISGIDEEVTKALFGVSRAITNKIAAHHAGEKFYTTQDLIDFAGFAGKYADATNKNPRATPLRITTGKELDTMLNDIVKQVMDTKTVVEQPAEKPVVGKFTEITQDQDLSDKTHPGNYRIG